MSRETALASAQARNCCCLACPGRIASRALSLPDPAGRPVRVPWVTVLKDPGGGTCIRLLSSPLPQDQDGSRLASPLEMVKCSTFMPPGISIRT